MTRHLKAPWVIVAAGFHRDGGMDKANHALAEYLLEQGVTVHIVGHKVDSELAKHSLAQLHIVRPPAGMYSLGEPLLDRKGRSVARNVVSRWPGARVVVNGGNCIWPDINWAHYVHHAWRPSGAGGSWWHGVKAAAFDAWCRKRERAAFSQARLVITNSQTTTRHLVENGCVDQRKVRTIYLGSEAQWGLVRPDERDIARQELNIATERPVAVFVGALGFDHRKGFDVLFEAWRKLCSRAEWDVDLLVAGNGRALPMWQEKVLQTGLAGRIRLLGFYDRVSHLLAATDLLVSPVRYESYGLNVQEAICRGVPALVSSSAGIAERYFQQLGPMLLPDPENMSDLVERLLKWRESVPYWKQAFLPLSEKLRLRTWKSMAEDIVSLVEENSQPGSGNYEGETADPDPNLEMIARPAEAAIGSSHGARK